MNTGKRKITGKAWLVIGIVVCTTLFIVRVFTEPPLTEEPVRVTTSLSISADQGGGNYSFGPYESDMYWTTCLPLESTITVSGSATDVDEYTNATSGTEDVSEDLTLSWGAQGWSGSDNSYEREIVEADREGYVMISLNVSDEQTPYRDPNAPVFTAFYFIPVDVEIEVYLTLFGRGDQTDGTQYNQHLWARGYPGPGIYTWSSAAGIFDADDDGFFAEEGDSVILVEAPGNNCTMPFRATEICKDVPIEVEYLYKGITATDSEDVTVVGVEIVGHDEEEYVAIEQEITLTASPCGPSPGDVLWTITGTQGTDYEMLDGTSLTDPVIMFKFLTGGDRTVDVQYTYTGSTPNKTVSSTREDTADEDEDGETNDFIPDPAEFIIPVANIVVDGLPDTEVELNPGLYINVNWGDDDFDGWTNGEVPPDANYTGDKDDSRITGGDNDFRSFTLSITPDGLPGKVILTFPENIKVWETSTKKKVGGASSGVASGTEFNPDDLPKFMYIEGQSGTAHFMDAEMKAEYKQGENVLSHDIINITVFEVLLAGFFDGNQHNDCQVKHSTFNGSSDRNGIISWDDPDPNRRFFHNCMEDQGTIKPSSVTNEASFNFKRDHYSILWACYEYIGQDEWISTPEDPEDIEWRNDEGPNAEDNTPSNQDHIYQIDSPGRDDRECADFKRLCYRHDLRD